MPPHLSGRNPVVFQFSAASAAGAAKPLGTAGPWRTGGVSEPENSGETWWHHLTSSDIHMWKMAVKAPTVHEDDQDVQYVPVVTQRLSELPTAKSTNRISRISVVLMSWFAFVFRYESLGRKVCLCHVRPGAVRSEWVPPCRATPESLPKAPLKTACHASDFQRLFSWGQRQINPGMDDGSQSVPTQNYATQLLYVTMLDTLNKMRLTGMLSTSPMNAAIATTTVTVWNFDTCCQKVKRC